MPIPAGGTPAEIITGDIVFVRGGLSVDYITGSVVKAVTEDEVTGSVEITFQDPVTGLDDTVMLDGSLLINAAPDADPQPTENQSNFEARRLWWDGITLRHLVRTPGHGLQASWPAYASASYRGEFRDDPPNFEDGENYYHLGAHRFVYRINGRNVGGTPSGWRGHVANQAAADARVSGNDQLFEWNDNVHISSGYAAPSDDTFFWESLSSEPYALDNSEVDDDESDVQGTVSGRTLARGVGTHERFTEVEQEILDDLSRITFPHPTDDWAIRQTYSARDFFTDRYATFLSLGWDTDNRLRALSGDGHVARLGGHDRGRIYDGTEKLRAGLISGDHWLFLRDNTVHGGSDIERAPVDGGDSSVEFEINSIRYFSMFADPDSGTLLGILRRISATDMEVGLLAYDATAGTVTAEDTITLTRAHIDAALGADFLPLSDIHRESAGGAYQDVAGAILEGDTLYLLLTDILKTDGHTTSALVGFTLAGTPNNRTLTVLAENAVDELPIADELTSGILPLEADELFIARATAAYRLSPPPTIAAADVTVDTSNFDGKLAPTDDTVQKVVDKVDDFIFAAGLGGNPEWADVQNRPNRPSAQELIEGTSVDEAVASVSDVVAIGNAHVKTQLANDDPQNVGNAAAEGDGGTASRHNHGHRFPHDSTLEYDDANEQFGVSIHDVVEHLQESIRYFTDGINYANISNTGHSAGQIYATGPFPTTISHIQAQLGPLIGFPFFEAVIYRVSSDRIIEAQLGRSHPFSPQSNNPHTWSFVTDDNPVGVPIPTDSHIAILFHNSTSGVELEMRQGTEASNSPGKSYQDADNDFRMVNSAVYEHSNPSVGDDTEQHGDANDIRGNIKIFYVVTYDHGRFVGDNFALSDAIPQANSTDGSAGDSEEGSRSDHSHPGTAGGAAATLGGNTAETLFDNRATTETALSVLAGAPDWSRTIDFGFSRALVEDDDDKDLRIRFQMTQGGQIRHFGYLVSADTFRLMPEYPAVSGNVLPINGHLVFGGADGRTARSALSLFSRLNIGIRQRTTTGEDVLRILVALSSNANVAATNIRGIIELVPRVENLTIAGGSPQQQSSGAVLTRSTVADGVQQTTNAFEFDVRVGGTIGVGNYQINPIPVVDIFDLVASIRVDGRAAFPMRLSKEQFDLVGESPEVVQTGAWPFAGTGGTTWGDVTEIPCAMMYIDHVTDGIVKNQINPQRQQIGWTIEGSIVATAILFFFDYDDAGNLTNVRVVAFSNSVVVIEGLHIHYWQAAT